MQCQDPDECWRLFKIKFFNVLDKHALIKEFSSRSDHKEWVTTEYLENCNERDDLLRVAQRTGSEDMHQRYKRVRNRYASTL